MEICSDNQFPYTFEIIVANDSTSSSPEALWPACEVSLPLTSSQTSA